MIFSGWATHYKRPIGKYLLTVNPNLLCYWSQYAATNYSVNPITQVPRFYGTEFNIFTFLHINDYCKWIGVLLLFFPGSFYKALQNQPLTNTDYTSVNALQSGMPTNFNPLINSDPALVINIGLEWDF